jgi:phosphatidylserine decarboxylase
VSYTPVGAYNVGSIVLNFERELHTNTLALRNPNLGWFSVRRRKAVRARRRSGKTGCKCMHTAKLCTR